jgi:hypothetical protein
MMVVARSRLIDAWALTVPLALAASVFCIWLIGLAAMLKHVAERARQHALHSMRADLQWLEGSQLAALKTPFKGLIDSVESNRGGAFAGFFDQPLFTALLVPLGGAGGAQLFDHLLLGR